MKRRASLQTRAYSSETKILELRRLPTASFWPSTTSATSMARGPRRLRLKGRFFLVRDVVTSGDLRQHYHSRLADPLRWHVPQRRRHRRVRHRPRLGPPRSCRHDLQVSLCNSYCKVIGSKLKCQMKFFFSNCAFLHSIETGVNQTKSFRIILK